VAEFCPHASPARDASYNLCPQALPAREICPQSLAREALPASTTSLKKHSKKNKSTRHDEKKDRVKYFSYPLVPIAKWICHN
jgi:hypothetical protein